jgi:hypothetical protein
MHFQPVRHAALFAEFGQRHRVVAQRLVGRSRDKGGPGAWAVGYPALHKAGKIVSK